MSDTLTTLSVLKFLAATYEPRWKPSGEQLTAWTSLLADIPPEDLKRAAVQFSQNSVHPPTVADLRKLALPDTTAAGDEAFELVRRAAHHASRYSDEKCQEARDALKRKDPLLIEALNMVGGFSYFWDMLTDDLPTHRAQFRNIWDSIQKREKQKRDSKTARLTLAGGNNTRLLQ